MLLMLCCRSSSINSVIDKDEEEEEEEEGCQLARIELNSIQFSLLFPSVYENTMIVCIFFWRECNNFYCIF